MGGDNWTAHLTQISTLMKGQPFWKVALFGVMCIRRQQPVYERLCVGREWGNPKGMAKVVERFWKAIPTGYAIGDSYLGIIEDSVVVATEDWDALAIEYIQNTGLLLELFESKDKKATKAIAERNLEFLHIYLDFEATDYRGLHPLTEAEQAFQLQLAEELRAVENKDKRDCIQKYHDQPVGSILQEAWFRDYPDYKPVRRKKAGPGSDGLRFRTAHQRSCVTNKDYVLCWQTDARELATLEAYRNSEYYGAQPMKEVPPVLQQTSIMVHEFVRGQYQQFYSGLCFRYQKLAQKLYLMDQSMADVLKALHQSAMCAIISSQLWQLDMKPDTRRPGWGYQHTSVQQAMLIYRYDSALELMDDGTPPYTRLLGYLFQGKYQEAEALLPACEEKADDIYRGADARIAAALCKRDADEIRACAVKFLRAIRSMEGVYCEVFPIPLILAVRCAAQMGVPIRKIEVSELPEQLIGTVSPFDQENSMPFGADLLGLPMDFDMLRHSFLKLKERFHFEAGT